MYDFLHLFVVFRISPLLKKPNPAQFWVFIGGMTNARCCQMNVVSENDQ